MNKLFLPGEITERFNCCDRIEPLCKHSANPVLVADRPWETYVGYPCVIYSAGTRTFRMWYHVCKELADRLNPTAPLVDGFVMQYEMYVCYAESADGLHWKKPALNLMRVKEYGDNNIVVVDSGFIGGQATVIEDSGVAQKFGAIYPPLVKWFMAMFSGAMSCDTSFGKGIPDERQTNGGREVV